MQEIEVVLDDKIKSIPLFKDINKIEFDKYDIFKYGIMNEDVPLFIEEDAFDYFQGKIPSLEQLYSDHIHLEDGVIFNYSTGESKIKVSEIIGVGVGLLFFITLLNIPVNTVRKIPASNEKKKYMDFVSETEKGKYELECKGTINEGNKGKFLEHIEAKKEDSKNIKSTQIGTITFARRLGEDKKSYIFVTDDYSDKQQSFEVDIKKYFQYYSLFLSLSLDSTYYNRAYSNFFNIPKPTPNSIIKSKFYTSIIHNGVRYFGECFDRRLCFNRDEITIKEHDSINQILNKLTKIKGIYKYFVGIDEKIIEGFNNLNISYFINNMNVDRRTNYEISDNEDFTLAGDDGIIFIRKSEGNANYFDNIFDECEVEKRLRLYIDYLDRNPHECGATCTSWGKEGKPCEILTYREHCHFHR